MPPRKQDKSSIYWKIRKWKEEILTRSVMPEVRFAGTYLCTRPPSTSWLLTNKNISSPGWHVRVLFSPPSQRQCSALTTGPIPAILCNSLYSATLFYHLHVNYYKKLIYCLLKLKCSITNLPAWSTNWFFRPVIFSRQHSCIQQTTARHFSSTHRTTHHKKSSEKNIFCVNNRSRPTSDMGNPIPNFIMTVFQQLDTGKEGCGT